jgi:hypothetical protein
MRTARFAGAAFVYEVEMIALSSLRNALLVCCIGAAMASTAEARRGDLRYGGRSAANTASVEQHGRGNAAAVVQNGQGNDATLRQSGRNNTGAITQIGDGNAACLYQMGRNLSGSINQLGDNQSVALIQTPAGVHPVPIQVCANAGPAPRGTYSNLRPGR